MDASRVHRYVPAFQDGEIEDEDEWGTDYNHYMPICKKVVHKMSLRSETDRGNKTHSPIAMSTRDDLPGKDMA